MIDRIDDFDDDDDVISIELGVSRRKLMKQLGAVGLVGSVAGCEGLQQDTATPTSASTEASNPSDQQQDQESGSSESVEAPPFKRVASIPPFSEINNANPDDPQRRMVLVNQNGENQFWVPCTNGLNDALNKLGWKGQMLAPNGYDETKQVEILNTTIDSLESGRDIIGSTIMGPEAYQQPVNKALDNEIFFFQWNTTHPDWTPAAMREQFGRTIPYVGQRAYRSGWAVGTTAQEKAAEIIGDDEEWVVLPTLSVPGHPALENRIRGIRDSFKGMDNVTMQETLDVSTDISQGTSRIQDRYNANQFNILCGCGFWGPTGMSSLVENEGLETFVSGGFDFTEGVLDALQNGQQTFTVGQDPYSQGFMPVMLSYAYMDRGMPPKDYVTGAEIVDQENVDFAAQRSGAWSDLRQWQKQNYNNN